MSKLPLTEYVDYLHRAGLSEESVTLYASAVRSFLERRNPARDVTALELVEHVQRLPLTLRGRFRAGWRRFRDFASGQGRELVTFSLESRQLLAPRFPVLVKHLPGFLKDTNIPLRVIPRIRQGDVGSDRENGDLYFFFQDRKWGRVEHRLAAEKKEDNFFPIERWARPSGRYDKALPLIPDGPEASMPMRLGLLQAIVDYAKTAAAVAPENIAPFIPPKPGEP